MSDDVESGPVARGRGTARVTRGGQAGSPEDAPLVGEARSSSASRGARARKARDSASDGNRESMWKVVCGFFVLALTIGWFMDFGDQNVNVVSVLHSRACRQRVPPARPACVC